MIRNDMGGFCKCPTCGTNAPFYMADEGTCGFEGGVDIQRLQARLEAAEKVCRATDRSTITLEDDIEDVLDNWRAIKEEK